MKLPSTLVVLLKSSASPMRISNVHGVLILAFWLVVPEVVSGQSLDDYICLTEGVEESAHYKDLDFVIGDHVRTLFVYVVFKDDTTSASGWPLGSNRLELPGWAFNIIDSNQNPATFRPNTMTGMLYQQSGGDHLFYGDIYPQIDATSVAYEPKYPNSAYWAANGGGYGYLVEEVLDSLVTVPGFDIGHYANNDIKQIDHIVFIIRNDYSHCSGCGVAWLTGFGATSGTPAPVLSYYSPVLNDSVSVDMLYSGQISCFNHGRWGLVMHEYGHRVFRPVQQWHTAIIPNRDVPSNDAGGTLNYDYNVMCGPGGSPYCGGPRAFAAQERIIRGWIDPTELSVEGTSQLGDFYDTGDAFYYDLQGGPADRGRITIVNRRTWHDGQFEPFFRPTRGGLYFEHTTLDPSDPNGNRTRYRILPADNNLYGFSSFERRWNAYSPQGDRSVRQLTPWTRPNSNGYNVYPVGYQPDWIMIDDVRYTGAADSTMAFEFYPDVRSLNLIPVRADSWMGAETSGTVFSGEVLVKSGVTLTLWQSADIEFVGGLILEPGGHLVVEDDVTVTVGDGQLLGGPGGVISIGEGAVIRLGDGAVVRSGSLTTTGTASNPVIFERNGSQAWSGIELRGQLWEGPLGPEGGHHLAHTRIIGADVGVDVKAEWASLSHVELIENGVGLMSDYFDKCDGMLCGPARSEVSLGHVLVEGSASHGLYIRNADAYLSGSTVHRNAGYGVYVQNAVFKSFFENVIRQNGDSDPLMQQMDGLRVANNGEVSTGRRGDMWGWPGLNRFDDNAREIGYLAGGYLFMGEDFDPYDPVGHFNTISSSSTGCWILNNSGTTLMAQVNYWGDESGPPSHALCGFSPISYEPVHDQDETGGSGGGYRPDGPHGVLAAGFDHSSASARDGGMPLGDRIRQVRSQLANNLESPSASARVRHLTVLHRRDVGNQTGEWAESYALLTQLRLALLDQDPSQLPPGLRRASERSVAALLRVALAHHDYEQAVELVTAYDGLVVGAVEARELALSAINVDEVFARYDDAIARIEALVSEIGSSDDGLVSDLEFMAAVIAAKRDEAGDAGRGAPPETPFAATQADGSSTMTFNLGPAFPNPTAGGSELPLVLPEAAHVMVAVYDVLGRRVAVLVDGRMDAGQHRVHFASGSVSAGLYVVRAELAPDAGIPQVFTRRVTVVR